MSKRTNWKTEFAALLGSERLTGRDRTFIESLHRHWSTPGKAMTSGRKHHFFLVKERVAAATARLESGESDPMLARLAATLQRTPTGSWDHGFVTSLQNQYATRAHLSPRQKEILVKIESRYTDEALAAARGFSDNYGEAERTKARRIAKYYEGTTYFRDLVDRLLTDDEFIPTKKQYDAITGNKYAAKVLEGYASAPKYVVGSTVMPRSGCAYNQVQRFKRGAIIIGDGETIKSACKGNRMYKILPIGGIKPILVEERHLKVRR